MRSWLGILTLGLTLSAAADDWPQWMGPRRDDVWREEGILEQFPAKGPPVLWRVPIGGSFSGPAVARDRLFVLDRPAALTNTDALAAAGTAPKPVREERVLCLDARNGKALWKHAYPSDYNIGYPEGPRTTPTVSQDRVFTLGAMGDLLCLRVDNGEVIWAHNFPKEYQAKPPAWGWSAHPLLDEDRLICLVGGSNTAVVAF